MPTKKAQPPADLLQLASINRPEIDSLPPPSWRHDGKTYIDDETLARLPVGNASHYGPWLANDRAEAGALVFDFLAGLTNGKDITARQYGFVAWLLDPVIGGKDPNPLPYKGKRGRPPNSPDLRAQGKVLAVQRMRSKAKPTAKGKRKNVTLIEAIAEVTGHPRKPDESLRGHYERANKTALDSMNKSARHLKAYVRLVKRRKK